MPKIGKEVITPDGNGTVVDLNILKETVRVRIPKGDSTEQKDYPMDQVQRLHPAPRNKQDDWRKNQAAADNAVLDEENSVLVAEEEYDESSDFVSDEQEAESESMISEDEENTTTEDE